MARSILLTMVILTFAVIAPGNVRCADETKPSGAVSENEVVQAKDLVGRWECVKVLGPDSSLEALPEIVRIEVFQGADDTSWTVEKWIDNRSDNRSLGRSLGKVPLRLLRGAPDDLNPPRYGFAHWQVPVGRRPQCHLHCTLRPEGKDRLVVEGVSVWSYDKQDRERVPSNYLFRDVYQRVPADQPWPSKR